MTNFGKIKLINANSYLVPSAKYKHLFFDLDHTLWDFDVNAKHTLTELYQEFELQVKVTPAFNDFYTRYLHHNQVLWARYQNGFISVEELKWRRMWRTLLDFKVGSEVLAKNLSQRFLEILPTKKEVFPHTNEILSYLQDRGYVLHLITNGFEKTQRSKLTNSGLDRYFTHIITSECSNSLKPHREIFEYALLKAGANSQNSIMIGDNLAADIQGAHNAGIDSLHVNHINVNSDSIRATFTVTHLSQLEHIF